MTVCFGEPIEVQPNPDRKAAARELTDTLEHRVQEMLDRHAAG